jgi:hypothetical protein
VSPRPTSTPHYRRLATLATAGVAAVSLFAACADVPTAPRAAEPETPSFEQSAVKSTTTTSNATYTSRVNALQWARSATSASVSGVIGAEGGSIAITGGARLIVPRGAVSGPVTFRMTRLPGRIVAYDFQPHGIRFAVPVQIEHPIAGVIMQGVTASSIQGAYFASTTALDQSSATAQVSEFRPTLVAIDRGYVRFSADHFSGYMVSTGRSRYY